MVFAYAFWRTHLWRSWFACRCCSPPMHVAICQSPHIILIRFLESEFELTCSIDYFTGIPRNWSGVYIHASSTGVYKGRIMKRVRDQVEGNAMCVGIWFSGMQVNIVSSNAYPRAWPIWTKEEIWDKTQAECIQWSERSGEWCDHQFNQEPSTGSIKNISGCVGMKRFQIAWSSSEVAAKWPRFVAHDWHEGLLPQLFEYTFHAHHYAAPAWHLSFFQHKQKSSMAKLIGWSIGWSRADSVNVASAALWLGGR